MAKNPGNACSFFEWKDYQNDVIFARGTFSIKSLADKVKL
jgi:hypothetical protein